MNTEIVKIIELKTDDIFSFRTIMKPIWWRFIEIRDDLIIYEEIRSKFRHSTSFKNILVKTK